MFLVTYLLIVDLSANLSCFQLIMQIHHTFNLKTNKMVNVQEIDSETLMNCVQNFPALYDKSSVDYKILLRKKNAWREIAAKLGIYENSTTTRYNSIRTNFSKYIRKQKAGSRSGAGRNDLPETKEEKRSQN